MIRVRVVGGPCGKPIVTPNSANKRGWSMTGVRWRFETFEQDSLPAVQPCGDALYVLRHDDKGKPLYVHEPDVALQRLILAALGRG